jgi:hypothetical protein
MFKAATVTSDENYSLGLGQKLGHALQQKLGQSPAACWLFCTPKARLKDLLKGVNQTVGTRRSVPAISSAVPLPARCPLMATTRGRQFSVALFPIKLSFRLPMPKISVKISSWPVSTWPTGYHPRFSICNFFQMVFRETDVRSCGG